MKCNNCGKELSETAIYCSRCGKTVSGQGFESAPQFDIDRRCKNCGNALDAGSLFCSKCGKGISQEEKIETPSTEFDMHFLERWKLFIAGAVCIVVIVALVLGIGSKPTCSNGCGEPADPNCMAGMCDDCCDYWLGINGCYRGH